MGLSKCPNCGHLIGDTVPVCIDCGHHLGVVEECEECHEKIPRGQKACPKCAPKLAQYMGLNVKPKVKAKTPPPKPPPKTPPPRETPKVGAELKPLGAYGSLDKKEDKDDKPRRELKLPPRSHNMKTADSPVERPRTPFVELRDGAQQKQQQSLGRKPSAAMIVLGVVMAAFGGWLAMVYLPAHGLDESVLALFPGSKEQARSLMSYMAFALVGLGALQVIRGALRRPRVLDTCPRCGVEVSAFNRSIGLRCSMCGRYFRLKPLNILAVFCLWVLLVGLVGAFAAVALHTYGILPRFW
jgi:hypothetical protein